MIKIDPLYKYRKPQALMDLAAELVVEFYKTGETHVLREITNGELKVSKIPMLFHIMGGLQGELGRKDQKIAMLNEKIKEMGIELSQLKRQNK